MKKYNRGFTLVELMIVITIIGILAGLAYPSYTGYVKKANRADAIDSLLSLAGRMEEFYMNNSTYVGATVGVAGTVGSDQTSEGLYTLSISGPDGTGDPDAFGYRMKATPTGSDPACGFLTLDSLGQKGVENGSVAGCW